MFLRKTSIQTCISFDPYVASENGSDPSLVNLRRLGSNGSTLSRFGSVPSPFLLFGSDSNGKDVGFVCNFRFDIVVVGK